jgi:hypothetical protein
VSLPPPAAAPDTAAGLQVLDPVDPDHLELDAWTLLGRLGRPTLLRVPAVDPDPAWRPRAVVVLQHGDEHTGLDALLRVLREDPPRPYDLHVLVGNVTAALAPPGFAHRMLPGQPDMNRAWRPDGTVEVPDDPLSVATREALRRLRALDLAALVDLHNTTGANPFHALVARTGPAELELAALFTTTVVEWDQRRHTLMEALADRCPCVSVECGLAGPQASLAFAVDGLRRYLGAPDPGALGTRTRVELLDACAASSSSRASACGSAASSTTRSTWSSWPTPTGATACTRSPGGRSAPTDRTSRGRSGPSTPTAPTSPTSCCPSRTGRSASSPRRRR